MRPALRAITLGGLAIGAVLGALLTVAASGVVDYTNRTEFCVSCHEMNKTVYQELQASVHWTNPAGVRAVCADCHVPRDFWPKLVRKAFAVNDVYHSLLGSIDTPQKFHAKRAELAERVWAYMKASDSRECRSCHGLASMNLDKQALTSRNKHSQAISDGKTCIDCHKGVAHKLPPADD